MDVITHGWDEYIDADNINEIFKNIENLQYLPPRNDILNAFKYVPPTGVRVILMGQDPYPTIGVANGLSFAVNSNINMPASLRNIFKELRIEFPNNTFDTQILKTLEPWAKQGVLLLNSSLTVSKGKPNSMLCVWSEFINNLLSDIDYNLHNIVFLCLGEKSRNMMKSLGINNTSKNNIFTTNSGNYIVVAGHPSPLNRTGTFLGSNCFNVVNDILLSLGRNTINWTMC